MTTPPTESGANKRHLADYRDEIEHAEVVRILSELPEDHPVCVAYSSGAKQASDSLTMTRLEPIACISCSVSSLRTSRTKTGFGRDEAQV